MIARMANANVAEMSCSATSVAQISSVAAARIEMPNTIDSTSLLNLGCGKPAISSVRRTSAGAATAITAAIRSQC